MNYSTYTRFWILTLICILASISISSAQDTKETNPPQQRGARGGQFVTMEKQMVLDSISGLNDDQKLIINAIYEDYEKALTAARSEATGDRQVMREKMTGIRDGKNEAMKAVLSEEQYQQFEAMLARRRVEMQNRRPNN